MDLFQKKKGNPLENISFVSVSILSHIIPVLIPFLTDTQKYENIWDGEKWNSYSPVAQTEGANSYSPVAQTIWKS